MAAGVVQIPWYATLFRGDPFEAALREIAPIAMRYGATDYVVYRNRDDMYKFLQCATFEDKSDFEAYWYGPEMVDVPHDLLRLVPGADPLHAGPTSWSRAAVTASGACRVGSPNRRRRRPRRACDARAR